MQHIAVFCLIIILAQAYGINITTKGRIIGGQSVGIQLYPYMVSVRYNDFHICGGSIISPDTILTAAHCTHVGNRLKFTVRSGSNMAYLGEVHQVIQIQEHFNYNPDIKSHDVAKLKITPPITYSMNRQPIKLCSQRPADNTLLVVSGWGRHKGNDNSAMAGKQQLQAAYVRAVNQKNCARQYKNREVNSVMMCAAASGKDSCQGDSGGPLVDPKSGEQCGVVSWGIGCAHPSYPGVYASVPDLLNFLQT